jgi:DNA polymerase III delta prime subunit
VAVVPIKSPIPRKENLPLAERWRPRSLDEVAGQWEGVKRLRDFAASWMRSSHPPPVRVAVLEGPPGTGKTSAAQALANDMGWGIVEMNASDARNEDAFDDVAGRASITNTFTEDGRYLSSSEKGRNLILIDEADDLPGAASRTRASRESAPPLTFREFVQGRYGTVSKLNDAWGLTGAKANDSFNDIPKNPTQSGWDRFPSAAQSDLKDWTGGKKRRSYNDEGGVAALKRLVETTMQPVVLTANDAYPLFRSGALSKEGTLRIRFPAVDLNSLGAWLHDVIIAEKITLTRDAFEVIVDRSKGDLRAALNDLEALSALPAGTDPMEVLGARAVATNLFDTTRHFLGGARFIPSVEVMSLTDAAPDDIWPWIEENIPNFAEDVEGLVAGYETLAAAQLHIARASRWRVWGLWSYANELMAGGVSIAIHHGAPAGKYHYQQVDFPRILSRLGGARERRWVRDSLLAKIGRTVHMSKARAGEEMLPLLQRLFAQSAEDESLMRLHDFQLGLARQLALEPPEIAYLLDVPSKHPSVTRLTKEEHEPPARKASTRARSSAKGKRKELV